MKLEHIAKSAKLIGHMFDFCPFLWVGIYKYVWFYAICLIFAHLGGKANLSTSIRHIKRAAFAPLITNLLTGAGLVMPGLGCRVRGTGIVRGAGCRFSSAGLSKVPDSGYLDCSGCRVPSAGFVRGAWFRVPGSRFGVSGSRHLIRIICAGRCAKACGIFC